MVFTDLSKFDNSNYEPGRNFFIILLWYFTNCLIFKNPLFIFSRPKVMILKIFGAKVGMGIVIKPSVSIKYPWLLELGDYVWIGENVWMDNLVKVRIGSHVCLSQGSMLLTGNHDYKKPSFDLVTGEIVLQDGAWIGAKAVVCPGVCCGSHSVLSVASVATSNLDSNYVYQGNPARKVRIRVNV